MKFFMMVRIFFVVSLRLKTITLSSKYTGLSFYGGSDTIIYCILARILDC